MEFRLLGAHGGVDAPDDHLLATHAEAVGDVVGAGRGGRHAGDPHQVAVGIQVQRLDLLLDHGHLVARGRQRGDVQEGDLGKADHAVRPARKVLFLGWGDQQHFHTG